MNIRLEIKYIWGGDKLLKTSFIKIVTDLKLGRSKDSRLDLEEMKKGIA